eukprot:c10758_g1_i1.p1 GENE.c10758_g1_i1~~c10758_g1_i1.p1  ORF type:complete len:232 (+),score=46.56 c10758_g1_i1:34-696(+)
MSEGQADGQAQAVAELQARLVDAQNERDTWHNRYRTIIAQTLAILPNISAPPDPAASPKESGKDSPAPVPNVSLEDNNTKIEDVEDFVRRVRETVDYQARALENVKSKAHEKINKLNDEKRALVKKMKDLVNQFKTSEAKLNEEKKQMQDDQSRMVVPRPTSCCTPLIISFCLGFEGVFACNSAKTFRCKFDTIHLWHQHVFAHFAFVLVFAVFFLGGGG